MTFYKCILGTPRCNMINTENPSLADSLSQPQFSNTLADSMSSAGIVIVMAVPERNLTLFVELALVLLPATSGESSQPLARHTCHAVNSIFHRT